MSYVFIRQFDLPLSSTEHVPETIRCFAYTSFVTTAECT